MRTRIAITLLFLACAWNAFGQAASMPRATNAIASDLITVTTNAAGNPGQIFTRAMTMENLLRSLAGLAEWEDFTGASGVTPGDKGDITVGGGGGWTINAGAVTDAKLYQLGLIARAVTNIDEARRIYVSTSGNDTTGDGSFNKQKRELTNGVLAATSGKVVTPQPGRYTNGTTMLLGDFVSLAGSGQGITIVTSTVPLSAGGVGLQPGMRDSVIADLTIHAGDSVEETLSAPIGVGDAGVGSTRGFTNATLLRLDVTGWSDGLFIQNALPSSLKSFNSRWRSNVDIIVQALSSGHRTEFHYDTFVTTSTAAGVGNFNPMRINSGYTLFNGCLIVVSNGAYHEAISIQPGATVELVNTTIIVPLAGDMHIFNDGTLILSDPSQIDHYRIYGGGTIQYRKKNSYQPDDSTNQVFGTAQIEAGGKVTVVDATAGTFATFNSDKKIVGVVPTNAMPTQAQLTALSNAAVAFSMTVSNALAALAVANDTITSNGLSSVETTRNAAVSNACIAFGMTVSNAVYTTETTRNAAVSNACVQFTMTASNTLYGLIAGGATAWDVIGNPSGNGTIAFGNTKQDITTTLDSASDNYVFKISSTDADQANAVSLFNIEFVDTADPQATYATFTSDSGGAPAEDYKFGQASFVVGQNITSRFVGAIYADSTVQSASIFATNIQPTLLRGTNHWFDGGVANTWTNTFTANAGGLTNLLATNLPPGLTTVRVFVSTGVTMDMPQFVAADYIGGSKVLPSSNCWSEINLFRHGTKTNVWVESMQYSLLAGPQVSFSTNFATGVITVLLNSVLTNIAGVGQAFTNAFTRTATTVSGAGGGSTNYGWTLSTNSLNDFYLGSSNVHVYAVTGGTAGQPIYWNAYITNLSANTWGINFSAGTNRWRFSGVYGTNAPTVLTNDTMLMLSGRTDGSNTVVGYTYFKPGQ